MALTHSWQMLLLVRVFFGIGIGIKGATIPVYSAEVSPTVIRGALGEFRVVLQQRVACQKLTRVCSHGMAIVYDSWHSLGIW